VRIVASQNGTNITQTGGTLLLGVPGGQNSLDNLQAGQFVELEVSSSSNGCYISANKPIGVCTFLSFIPGVNIFTSSPAQCWIPATDQTAPKALIAPFVPVGHNNISGYYALVVTPTATQNNTKVSIGGSPAEALSGGSWKDHAIAGMSFYSMPLTNETASYMFTNQNGLIVLCFASGNQDTYYYLAGSAMRELDAAFYANDIHFQDFKENPICEGDVEFRAAIQGLHPTAPDRIKWYVDGAEEPGTLNQVTWSRHFSPGDYEIKMQVRFENNDTGEKLDILKIVSCNYSAEFFANDIHYSDLPNQVICNKTGQVDFRAEIEGLHPDAGSLKWFIDYNDGNGYVEEVSARDQQSWSKTFATGTYEIKMWVRYEDGTEETITSTLKVEVFWIKMKNVRY
jgi:hypothetical protein